jgi:hypothetical protein
LLKVGKYIPKKILGFEENSSSRHSMYISVPEAVRGVEVVSWQDRYLPPLPPSLPPPQLRPVTQYSLPFSHHFNKKKSL